VYSVHWNRWNEEDFLSTRLKFAAESAAKRYLSAIKGINVPSETLVFLRGILPVFVLPAPSGCPGPTPGPGMLVRSSPSEQKNPRMTSKKMLWGSLGTVYRRCGRANCYCAGILRTGAAANMKGGNAPWTGTWRSLPLFSLYL
jgi:hypothetical protein